MSGKKGEHEPEKEGVLATIWDYAKTFLIIFLYIYLTAIFLSFGYDSLFCPHCKKEMKEGLSHIELLVRQPRVLP